MSAFNGFIDRLTENQIPLADYFKGLGDLSDWGKVTQVAEPLLLLGSFAATVPYQLWQIKIVVDNMRAYEVGDSRRIKDPKAIIARRSLSALGGVLGTIGVVLGSGIFFAVGGSLKVATGVICLFVNARLFYEGYQEEQKLLKQENVNQEELRKARYKMLQGKMGFTSSATFIGYFVLTVTAGICPPVIAVGALAFALSAQCAYLEQEGSCEKLYRAKETIKKIGFINWIRGKDAKEMALEMESLDLDVDVDPDDLVEIAFDFAKRLEFFQQRESVKLATS